MSQLYFNEKDKNYIFDQNVGTTRTEFSTTQNITKPNPQIFNFSINQVENEMGQVKDMSQLQNQLNSAKAVRTTYSVHPTPKGHQEQNVIEYKLRNTEVPYNDFIKDFPANDKHVIVEKTITQNMNLNDGFNERFSKTQATVLNSKEKIQQFMLTHKNCEKQINELLQQNSDLQKEINKFKHQYSEYIMHKELYENFENVQKDLLDQIEQLKSQITIQYTQIEKGNSYKGQVDYLQKQLTDIRIVNNQIPQFEKEIQFLNENLSKEKIKNDKLNAQLKIVITENTEYKNKEQQQLIIINQRADQLEQELDHQKREYELRMTQLLQQEQQYKDRYNEMMSNEQNFKNQINMLIVNERNYKDQIQDAQKYQDQINFYIQKEKNYQDQLQQLNTYQEQLNMYIMNEKAYKDKLNELTKYQDQVNMYMMNEKGYKDKIQDLQSQLSISIIQKDNIKKYEQEIYLLNEKLANMTLKNQQLLEELNSLKISIQGYTEKINLLTSQYQNAANEIGRYKGDYDKYKNQCISLQQLLDQQKNQGISIEKYRLVESQLHELQNQVAYLTSIKVSLTKELQQALSSLSYIQSNSEKTEAQFKELILEYQNALTIEQEKYTHQSTHIKDLEVKFQSSLQQSQRQQIITQPIIHKEIIQQPIIREIIQQPIVREVIQQPIIQKVQQPIIQKVQQKVNKSDQIRVMVAPEQQQQQIVQTKVIQQPQISQTKIIELPPSQRFFTTNIVQQPSQQIVHTQIMQQPQQLHTQVMTQPSKVHTQVMAQPQQLHTQVMAQPAQFQTQVLEQKAQYETQQQVAQTHKSALMSNQQYVTQKFQTPKQQTIITEKIIHSPDVRIVEKNNDKVQVIETLKDFSHLSPVFKQQQAQSGQQQSYYVHESIFPQTQTDFIIPQSQFITEQNLIPQTSYMHTQQGGNLYSFQKQDEPFIIQEKKQKKKKQKHLKLKANPELIKSQLENH